MQESKKYIFITGGILSSLGKGVTVASLAYLLQKRGLSVHILKIDPYLNLDARYLNPVEHGEVFVTVDGIEADLDLGTYERFTGIPTNSSNIITGGKIYQEVFDRERAGYYGGKTVQIIPHVTNLIEEKILSEKYNNIDIILVELGGTVGDEELKIFLKAICNLKQQLPQDVLIIHMTLMISHITGEIKTRPTQHTLNLLQSFGIVPDIILCRSPQLLSQSDIHKIVSMTSIKIEAVFPLLDIDNIYKVPLLLHEHNIDTYIVNKLDIKTTEPDLSDFHSLLNKYMQLKTTINIALVGKYANFHESYKSLVIALEHAGLVHQTKVEVHYLEIESINLDQKMRYLQGFQGVIVPGGFGERGIPEMIAIIQEAREQDIAFLGICLGLQLAIVEYARNVLGLVEAASAEFEPNTPHPVIQPIHLIENTREQDYRDTSKYEMKIGSADIQIVDNSLASHIYGSLQIRERHRHRYEFNNAYRDIFEKSGMKFTGTSLKGSSIEIIELPNQQFFLGCQFHPEYNSRPLAPHPLFVKFIDICLHNQRSK